MAGFAKQVAKGHSFVVVKQSKPLFKIIPLESQAEENWEEVVNFTKIKKGGVKLDELLSRL